MKSIFLFVLSSLLFVAAYPQKKIIQGYLIDSVTSNPLQFATVTLFLTGQDKPETGTITDNKGAYVLNDLKTGHYTILFESIGYVPRKLKNITISPGQESIDLKTQILIPLNKNLSAVVLNAQLKIIDNRIDRLVFNAENDVSSQSGTAADVLKKVPQVSVDADGNVQLSGSSGIRFLINGKPSTAFGSIVADVLQSIPASQIKSIEVITNPGAKYDAQGLGGIINIILKTSKAKGYNGSLSLTAGTRQENGSLNLNARKNNFGVNLFFSGNKRLKSTIPFSSERLTNTGSTYDYLTQVGESKFERNGIQAGAGVDLTLKKFNTFSANVSLNEFNNDGSGLITQNLQVDKGGSIPAILSRINSANSLRFRNADLNVNYKRTFAKADRELEFAINTSVGNNKTRSFNEQSSLSQNPFYYSTESFNPGKTKETEVTLDFTEPLGKDNILGVGSKYSNNNIKSHSEGLIYEPTTQSYVTDVNLSNELYYNQDVYALYAEWSFKMFKTLQVKTGGRYERTEINDHFSNAQMQIASPGYNTFVPSIFLSRKIGDNQTIKLSYSKRIERPDYNDLNPFVNTTDPKNLSTGNPYLLPEIGQRFELSYNREFGKTGSILINLFYRLNDHDIQPYILYYPNYRVGDSLYTNVAVSTRQNIGTEKNTGINLFGDLHPTPKLGFRGNVFLFRRHTINNIDKGFNTNSFNYRFNINASYQFTKTFLSEFFGNFNSARHEAQGRYPSFTTYTLALRKQFWNKKGSIAITASNFMNKYVDQKTVLTSPAFSLMNLREIPFRSVGINFAWKFGKLEFKKDKPERDTNLNAPAGIGL